MQNTIKMIYKRKKGISSTVSIVLVLLLAISLMVMLSYFVFNMVQDIDLSPSFLECDEINKEINIIEGCYNNQTNELEIEMSNYNERNIDKIEFLILQENQGDLWTCNGSCENCVPLESGEKTYYMITEKPDSIEVSVNECKIDKRNVDFC